MKPTSITPKSRPLSTRLRALGERSKQAGQSIHPGPVTSGATRENDTKGNGLRVLHLATLDCGGAGIAAYRLHQGLRQIGVNSTMCVLHKSTNDPSVHWIQGIQDSGASRQAVSLWPQLLKQWGNTLQGFPDRSRSLCFFSTPDSVVSLEQQVKDFVVINLHWVAGLVDVASMPTALKGKKLVWTLHDMNPFTGGCHYAQDCTRYQTSCHDCPQLGPGPEDIVRNIWTLKRDSYAQLDLTVVTPSRWLGECSKSSALLGRFPHRVIPYGLDLEDDFRPMDRKQARQQLGLPEHARIVLFGASAVGDYRKGFDLFLAAIDYLPRLVSGKDTVVLAAFGQAQDLGGLKTPYKLHPLGHLNSPAALSAAYSAADVFVIPTREDNLPNTVLESLACGTPVVGFELGGLPDMVAHCSTGYLAPFPNVEALAKGVHWVFQQDAAKLCRDCRGWAETHYGLNSQADQYLVLYREASYCKGNA